MTKIYSDHYNNDIGCDRYENVLDSTAYHLCLSPAERATLLTTGAVVIHDLIMEPLLIQMETAPEERTAAEILYVNDYGVLRWWVNEETKEAGTVQL